MNIVTIMNYDFKRQEDIAMCLMWAHSVRKSCDEGDQVIVLSEKPLPERILDFIKQYGFTNEVCGSHPNQSLHHNLRFKMWNLLHLDMPYIFLDADILVTGNLRYLWERRTDKPWIGIDHQLNIPGHTSNRLFLNSGVQVVGEPDYFTFDEVMKDAERRNFKFEVPGRDQAALWSYFKYIGYDYTHPEIDFAWNACAGFVEVNQDDKGYWTATSKGLGESFPVYINHYWDKYKPWLIKCPAYAWYAKNCPIKVTDLN